MHSRRKVCARFVACQALLAIAAVTLGCSSTPEGGDESNAANPAAARPAQVAEDHAAAGRRLASEGQHERAVEQFTIALNAGTPGARPYDVTASDADILFRRGLSYLAMGFPDTAAEDFSAAIVALPDFSEAYSKRGRAYVELGDLYRGARDCTTAIRFDPNNSEAYHFRGLSYLRRLQYERATADFRRAIAIDPSLEPAIGPQLAIAYRQGEQLPASQGDASAAAVRLSMADESDSAPSVNGDPSVDDETTSTGAERTAAKPVVDDAKERFDKGRELQARREFDEALIQYTEAIAIDRDFLDAYLRRGETLLALGFPDTAIRDFDEAIRLDAHSPEAHRLQAEAFAELGSHQRAVMSATEAIHADPVDAQSYAIRGAAYVELGNWRRAIVDLQEALRRDSALKSQLAPTLAEAYRLREQAGVAAP